MGLIPVANDQIATIVTTLEMRVRPRPRPMPDAPLRLVRWNAPEPARYRTLFERIGGPWLWYSRLVMDDARLTAVTHDPKVRIHAAVDRRGIEIGMLELDDRIAGACELSYFGLVPEATGRGHGRWLMAQALSLAWTRDVERVWVHTCTLDHPAALGFYVRFGFTPIARTVETFPDPRLIGALPPDAAPQIPCLGGNRR